MLMPAVPNASAAARFREAPSRGIYVAAALAQFALRLPFYAAHHIQEDAYITFRSAFRWADAGDYSYNAGAQTPGVTSALYGPVVALLRLIFHSHAIAAVAVFNTIVVLAAAWLIAAAFLPQGRRRFWAWTLIAASPTALLLSYCGMETALIICILGALAFTVARIPGSPITLAAFVLAPLIRPDAIGFSFFFLLALFWIDRKRALFAAAATGVGLALMLLIQRLTSGSFLPATALAKEISNHPSHTLGAIAHRLAIVYIHRSVFTPADTKVLEAFSVLFTIVAIALAWAVARSLSQRSACVAWTAVAASMLLIPAVYAFGGVLFPWYTWPCTWLAQCALVLVAALGYCRNNAAALRWTTIAVLAILWISFAALRWSVSFNDGTQLYHYRADVGRWLHQRAAPTDTLFLEPAGYIPYFAELRTIDEVGIVSPEILGYKQQFPDSWWFEFVSQKQPTWLVERADMRHYETYQHQQLAPDEIGWFTRHYQLVREFHYDPAQYATLPWQLYILEHGSHADFLVYRLRQPSPQP